MLAVKWVLCIYLTHALSLQLELARLGSIMQYLVWTAFTYERPIISPIQHIYRLYFIIKY